jgi:hypothetical protein
MSLRVVRDALAAEGADGEDAEEDRWAWQGE